MSVDGLFEKKAQLIEKLNNCNALVTYFFSNKCFLSMYICKFNILYNLFVLIAVV